MALNLGFLVPTSIIPIYSEEMLVVHYAPLTLILLIIMEVIVADIWASPMMPGTSHLIIMPIP